MITLHMGSAHDRFGGGWQEARDVLSRQRLHRFNAEGARKFLTSGSAGTNSETGADPKCKDKPRRIRGMASFDDRKRGFEEKFKHEQELGFKISARRNKLLGLWAAQELKLPAAEHEAYAKSVVMADLEKPGDDDVVAKLLADFKAKGVDMTDHRIRHQLTELREAARKQVMAELK
jgi:hypothetical protein